MEYTSFSGICGVLPSVHFDPLHPSQIPASNPSFKSNEKLRDLLMLPVCFASGRRNVHLPLAIVATPCARQFLSWLCSDARRLLPITDILTPGHAQGGSATRIMHFLHKFGNNPL
ncbi:hypothetical protein CR155_05885 [Pollutimonas nitritireducens]|uniref:Uncharacterized protein n=1 Tax=Pollutimonas nitritireducens TaxID=2045209 RepID=A0A2N4UIY3_9BURK|nr:hypothetical protein CR155_05885 [Pollutimonas nitritireducens]